MSDELMQNVAKDAGSISGTMILLIVLCAGWLSERIYKFAAQKKNGNPSWKEVNAKLDKKVNGDDCHDFRSRIGKESDEHRKNISDIKDGISVIKADIGYIKGKIG